MLDVWWSPCTELKSRLQNNMVYNFTYISVCMCIQLSIEKRWFNNGEAVRIFNFLFSSSFLYVLWEIYVNYTIYNYACISFIENASQILNTSLNTKCFTNTKKHWRCHWSNIMSNRRKTKDSKQLIEFDIWKIKYR